MTKTEDWVLVPREPTQEMVSAAELRGPYDGSGEHWCKTYYHAMLAAAPAAPPSPDARVEELERALRAIGSTDTYTTADGKDQTAGLMRKMARAALAKPAR